LDAVAGEVKFLDGAIVRVGDAEITDFRSLHAALARDPDKPLTVTVRRSSKANAETADDEVETPALKLDATFEVLPRPMKSFGLVMKMGPIAGVQVGSPAAEAGLKIGDVIEQVDGKSINDGTSGAAGWNPTTLPDEFRKAALENRPVELVVRRPAAEGEGQGGQTLTLNVQPRVPTTFHSILPPDTPIGVPAIGAAYHIASTVHAVVADGAAAAAGVRPGDDVASARFILPKDAKSWDVGPPIEFGPTKRSWPQLFSVVQLAPPGTAVEFTLKRGESAEPVKVKVDPTVVAGAFTPDRGFNLMPISKIRIADSFGQQVRYGWDETVDALLMVYRFLQKLGTQVPLTALGGPITIAKAAGMHASEGLAQLLIFLTMLSANLAVINFLPIPLLDGGHMVFLLYEGVRGRPANQRFVVAMHMIGFAFIVTLMLFVLGLDFGLIDRNL
jgi:regulator of sigma E protease